MPVEIVQYPVQSPEKGKIYLVACREKAPPITPIRRKSGNSIEMFQSTDYLKWFNILETTIGKLRLLVRVKKIGVLRYLKKLLLSLIKSNVLFRIPLVWLPDWI